MTTLALIGLLIWVYLLAFHGRFWGSGPALPPEPLTTAPPITVIVPARDEEAVIGDTISYLREHFPRAHLWVIDDDSDDRTVAEVLAGREIGRAHV